MSEIIAHNSIKSFNMGVREGVIKERIRVMEIIEEYTVSASTVSDHYTVESLTITPSELIKLVRAS